MSLKPSISSEPYTHEAHAKRCVEAAKAREVLSQYVQAKRGQIVYCAVIKAAYTVPNGPDCWTVETLWPEETRITVPVRNVLQCGGLTCSCVPVGPACSGAKPGQTGHAAEGQKGFTCPVTRKVSPKNGIFHPKNV
jgi:hypothetical protein